MMEVGQGPEGLAALQQKLRRRYQRHSRAHPSLLWKHWLACGLALAGLSALFLDRPALLWVRTEPVWLRAMAADLTDVGKSGWILFSAAAAGIGVHVLRSRAPFRLRLRRWRSMRLVHASLYIFVAVAASGILANLMKRAIGRARPGMLDELGTFSFRPFANDYDFESFPSGHATTVGALAMALAVLFPSLRMPILVIGMLLAITRTLIGAHYPSDVICGFAFGAWFSLMTAVIFARYGLQVRTGRGRNAAAWARPRPD